MLTYRCKEFHNSVYGRWAGFGPILTILFLYFCYYKTDKKSPTFLRYDTDCKWNDASNNSPITACIRCRGNVSTEPLPSNDMGIHIQTHKLKGEIYKVCRWDGFRWHDIHTKFLDDWFRHSKVNTGGVEYIDTQKAWWAHKPPFIFLKWGK
jgi:hypothetical protein